MNTLAITNAVLCSAIALRLMFFRRATSSHRPWAARVAYLLILINGSVPIRTIFGQIPHTDFASVAANAVLCLVIFAKQGNVVDLFRVSVGFDNWITRALRKTNDRI